MKPNNIGIGISRGTKVPSNALSTSIESYRHQHFLANSPSPSTVKHSPPPQPSSSHHWPFPAALPSVDYFPSSIGAASLATICPNRSSAIPSASSIGLFPAGLDASAQHKMTTAAKFEPNTQFFASAIPPMLSAAASIGGLPSSSSAASSSSSSAFATSVNPYWSGEWDLAAITRQAQDAQLAVHQLSSPSSAYYGQMAAAAAMSAVSASAASSSAAAAAAAAAAGPVWYPQAAATANYGCYYGLAAQRAAVGTAALNGYLGAAGHYAGGAAYGSPADYYSAASFPSYYSALSGAAATSMDPSKAFMMAAHQQQYGGVHQPVQQQYSSQSAANVLPLQMPITTNLTTNSAAAAANELHSAVPIGSELDSSPSLANAVAAPPRPSPPIAGQQKHQQNRENSHGAGGKEKRGGGGSRHSEKAATTSSSSKRSKKKKAAVKCNPAEPNNTRVFVWELEDICSIVGHENPYRPALDQFLLDALTKIVQSGFQLEHFEEFDHQQTNVDDAQLDEALQNAANSTAAVNGCPFNEAAQNGGGAMGNAKVEMMGPEENNNVHGQQQQQQEENPGMAGGGGGGDANGQQQNGGAGGGGGIAAAVANEGMRRLAAKYRHIRHIYEQHRQTHRLPELLDHCGINAGEFLANLDHIERMPLANAGLFRECLRIISERSPLLPHPCANVILSSSPTETAGVAGSLGRLLLCRVAEFVQPENVFCTSRIGKEAAIERLANQFQKKLILLVTTNAETRQLAKREAIPCWFLGTDVDLPKFRAALDILVGDILPPPLAHPQIQQQTGGGGATAIQLFGANGGDQKMGQEQVGNVNNFLQAVRG